jgi:hypothetical protein
LTLFNLFSPSDHLLSSIQCAPGILVSLLFHLHPHLLDVLSLQAGLRAYIPASRPLPRLAVLIGLLSEPLVYVLICRRRRRHCSLYLLLHIFRVRVIFILALLSLLVILSNVHHCVFRLLASLPLARLLLLLLLIIVTLGVGVPEGSLGGGVVISFLGISHELAELLLEERVQGVEN